ncbi:MAG: ABC transporter permease subunit, partial [Rhodospirillaceae bacterium]|nr:ABC transporter permease subunit [Rhodospirillaceae bacterium]
MSNFRKLELGRLITNERTRGYVIQIVLMVSLIAIILFFVINAINNLEKVGLASGYGFLSDTASFDINQRLIDYSSTSTYGRAIMVGGVNPILIAFLGIITATLIGFVCGVLRLSDNFLIRTTIGAYVEFVRNVPVLLQIIFWWVILLTLPKVKESMSFLETVFLNNRGVTFPSPVIGEGSGFVITALLISILTSYFCCRWNNKRFENTGDRKSVFGLVVGLIFIIPLSMYFLLGSPIGLDIPERGRFNLNGGINITPELFALWIALSTYTAAFISEIVRAGILSVSKGQIEAAKALGLPRKLIMKEIILPQALRVIIPPLTSQYLNLTKNSSLAVAIGYQDIVSIGDTVLNQSGHALEVVSIFMFFYLSLSLITSLFMNWYNKKIELVE